MFNRGVRAGIDTSAAFDAFLDVFRYCFAVHQLKDLYWACGDTFPGTFAFIIVDIDGDISFFKFFLHVKITSLLPQSVTAPIILYFLFTPYAIIENIKVFL